MILNKPLSRLEKLEKKVKHNMKLNLITNKINKVYKFICKSLSNYFLAIVTSMLLIDFYCILSVFFLSLVNSFTIWCFFIWPWSLTSITVICISIISSLRSESISVAWTRPDSGPKVNHSASKKLMLLSSKHVLILAGEFLF